MTVPYYFAVMYTKGGIATAPSDTPTVSVIDKDDNLLVDTQNATKLSNLAGHCVYAYDGVVGLACWGHFRSTDTTLDQQDLGSAGIPYLITSIDETADAIKLKTDNLPADPADQSAIEAAITAANLLGSGAITWPYTLLDTASDPIPNAQVWVTTDITGANVIASGLTNDFGIVTFYLDAGTVYVWAQKSGYNFTNPDTEVVS